MQITCAMWLLRHGHEGTCARARGPGGLGTPRPTRVRVSPGSSSGAAAQTRCQASNQQRTDQLTATCEDPRMEAWPAGGPAVTSDERWLHLHLVTSVKGGPCRDVSLPRHRMHQGQTCTLTGLSSSEKGVWTLHGDQGCARLGRQGAAGTTRPQGVYALHGARGLSPVTPYNSGWRGPKGWCVEFLMDGARASGAGRADWCGRCRNLCGTRDQYVEDNVCTDQVRDGFEMVQAHYTDCALVSILMLPLI